MWEWHGYPRFPRYEPSELHHLGVYLIHLILILLDHYLAHVFLPLGLLITDASTESLESTYRLPAKSPLGWDYPRIGIPVFV